MPVFPEPFRRLIDEGHWRSASELQADTPAEHFARGWARMAVGDDRGAREDYIAASCEFGSESEIEIAYLDMRVRTALTDARAVLDRHASDRSLPDLVRARALHLLGLAEGKLRRSSSAIQALVAATDLYGASGARAARAQVQDTIGSLLAAQGRLDQALSYYALSMVQKVRAGDRLGTAITLGNIGRVHLRAGRYRDAIECLDADLELCLELGDRRGEVRVMEDLGRTRLAEGSREDARVWLERARDLARERSYPDLEFFARIDLCGLLLSQADFDAAERELNVAGRCLPEGGEPYNHSVLAAHRARLRIGRGDRGGLADLERAVEEFRRFELPDQEIPARLELAERRLAYGDQAAAESQLRIAMKRARRDGYSRYLPRIREVVQQLALRPGGSFESDRVVVEGEAEDTPDGLLVLGRVGRGAVGEVLKVFDPWRSEILALKRFNLAEQYDPVLLDRLLRSARTEWLAASRIEHPGVARVHAVGVDSTGRTYVLQQFIDGVTLRQLLPGTNRTDPTRVRRVLGLAAQALEAVHAADVVHRDVKPENLLIVMREGREYPVWVDFGLARLPAREAGGVGPTKAGTFDYMAPERASGGTGHAGWDVYALGVIAFEWLVGTRPLHVRGRTQVDAYKEIATRSRARVRDYRRDLEPELVELVEGMLSSDPTRRPSMHDVGTILLAGIGDD